MWWFMFCIVVNVTMEKYSVDVYNNPLYLYFRMFGMREKTSCFTLNGGIILKQNCLQWPWRQVSSLLTSGFILERYLRSCLCYCLYTNYTNDCPHRWFTLLFFPNLQFRNHLVISLSLSLSLLFQTFDHFKQLNSVKCYYVCI